MSTTKKKSELQQNSKLSSALAYAKLGWSIIPLRETGNQKRPYVNWKKWQQERPSPRQIKRWLSKWPDANIGVVTGDVSKLAALDFDDVDALKDFRKKNGLHTTFRSALKSKTPRGYHYYYSLPEGETLSNMVLADNVELKAEGGIITLPPSIHIKAHKPYRWVRGNPIKYGLKYVNPLPNKIVKIINQVKNEPTGYGVTLKAACAANLLDPKRILAGIPEGKRNNTLFRYACSMIARKYRRKEVEAYILLAASNAKPQFPKKEALEAVKSAFSYSSSAEVSKLMEELNEKHAFIMLGGRGRILNEFTDPVFDRPDINFSRPEDFRNRYLNRKSLDQNGKEVLISKLWLESPDRCEYKGIIFEPKGDVPGYYNLWRGFAFKPKEGHWGLFKGHIKTIIAENEGRATLSN